MSQLVLVFNCGSSSIKFALIDPQTGQATASGLGERIGTDQAELTLKVAGQRQQHPVSPGNYEAAMELIFQLLAKEIEQVIAVGHRVVHGGHRFTKSVLIDQAVLDDIKACIPLAPLHNPANLQGIEIAKQHLPKLPHIACFDTAFHTTMTDLAKTYPVPHDWKTDHGVQRYGFHGISYQFVSKQAVDLLNLNPEEHSILIAHLGNGCSATAVHNGKSVDTTMGFTPLDGLMMGTRSGSIDPGIHAYMCDRLGTSINEITTLLNKQSGLKGVSGLSHDCRDLEGAKDNNAQAKLALDLFCYRLAKELGALATTLPRLDALIFTAGIGENSAWIREQTVARLGGLNLQLDKSLNTAENRATRRINQSSPAVAVIPTNEEWQICQDALAILKQRESGIWL